DRSGPARAGSLESLGSRGTSTAAWGDFAFGSVPPAPTAAWGDVAFGSVPPAPPSRRRHVLEEPLEEPLRPLVVGGARLLADRGQRRVEQLANEALPERVERVLLLGRDPVDRVGDGAHLLGGELLHALDH